ncbi:ROK family protein [Sabulicella rubraurantiaca]|uniref:ROK family protein n=1 Tax=Sabulicella rubraurantiaca TaxID=2811429 RepID=UPI001A95FB39|nr:ROK family transcriptional regulator [Sabulicella rubraurantiaca]
MDVRLPGTGVAALREHNQSLVMRQILSYRGVSRTDVAARIGLTDAAVSRITRDLIASGFVREGREAPAEPGQRGRRHVQLEADPNGAAFLAISLTIADRRVSLVDLSGRRRGEVALSSALPQDYGTLVADVTRAAKQLVARSRMPRDRVLGIAATTAGAVEQTRGRVIASSLAVLRGRDVGADLEKNLHMPAAVETVGNALGLAETHRVMQNEGLTLPGSSLLVHVAFGLGVSVMLEGVPIRSGGDERVASHVPVAQGRSTCVCGARGCLMAEAGGYGILRRMQGVPAEAPGQGWEDMRPQALRSAIASDCSGDAATSWIMAEAGRVLGRHLFALGAASAARRVIIGGPLAAAPSYVQGLRAGLAESFGRASETPPGVILSDTDYLHAAELLAIEEFALRRPLPLADPMA